MAYPNEAEATFDRLHPNSAPWGLDHPPINVGMIPGMVRYAPDRIMSDRMVECKGVGKDAILKIKLEQLYALAWWANVMDVYVFIWDSYRKRHATIKVGDLIKACEKNGVLTQFPDNSKPAWFMSLQFLPVDWTDDAP